jgi:hypothetical protein
MATQPAKLSSLMNDLPAAELPLIERTVGSAVIDRLRGNTTSLTQTYEAIGGTNPTTERAMQAVDGVFKSSANPSAAQAVAGKEGVGSFGAAWGKWDIPSGELALVERAIGNAYLSRLKGGKETLSAAYTAVGGDDPQSQSVFKSLDSVWQNVDLSDVLAALGEAAA